MSKSFLMACLVLVAVSTTADAGLFARRGRQSCGVAPAARAGYAYQYQAAVPVYQFAPPVYQSACQPAAVTLPAPSKVLPSAQSPFTDASDPASRRTSATWFQPQPQPAPVPVPSEVVPPVPAAPAPTSDKPF